MLTADPPSNAPNNRQFLFRLLKIISPILTKDVGRVDPEISLQYVLQYLLLKIENQYSKNYQFLFNYLHGKFGYLYDDQVAIHVHLMNTKMGHLDQTQNYTVFDAYRLYLEKRGLITPELIRNEMFTMKSDVELKFLMEIFGYEFISNESGDGTGALFVSERRRKKELEKVHLILNEVLSKPQYRVLYGIYNHWVALTGLSVSDREAVALTYNDPIGPEAKTIELDSIDTTHRFYIFKWNPTELSSLWQNIEQAIVADIKVEQNLQKAEAIKKALASKADIDEAFFQGATTHGKISMGEFREGERRKRLVQESQPNSLGVVPENSKQSNEQEGQSDEKSDSHVGEAAAGSGRASRKSPKGHPPDWDTDIDFDFDESK